MKRIERLVKTETGVYGIASADVEIQGSHCLYILVYFLFYWKTILISADQESFLH